MKYLTSLALSSICLVALAFPLRAQEAFEVTVEPTPIGERSVVKKSAETTEESHDSAKALQEMMGPEKFKAAGLDKLSPQELKNLEVSLKGVQRTVEAKTTEKVTIEAEKKASRTVLKKLESTESRVDGIMTALTGRSIIRLEDGTSWKQANPEDRYPAQIPDHPKAVVFRTGFGWKMRISGVPEFYVDPYRK